MAPAFFIGKETMATPKLDDRMYKAEQGCKCPYCESKNLHYPDPNGWIEDGSEFQGPSILVIDQVPSLHISLSSGSNDEHFR